MIRKPERLSNRAARYRGECHFPRVIPETGLLRILGRFGRPADPKCGKTVINSELEAERAAAGK